MKNMCRCCYAALLLVFNRYVAVLGGVRFAVPYYIAIPLCFWCLCFCSDAYAVRSLPALVGVTVAGPPHCLACRVGWPSLGSEFQPNPHDSL